MKEIYPGIQSGISHLCCWQPIYPKKSIFWRTHLTQLHHSGLPWFVQTDSNSIEKPQEIILFCLFYQLHHPSTKQIHILIVSCFVQQSFLHKTWFIRHFINIIWPWNALEITMTQPYCLSLPDMLLFIYQSSVHVYIIVDLCSLYGYIHFGYQSMMYVYNK